MRTSITAMLFTAGLGGVVMLSGCDPAVTESDVEQARNEVQEERQETVETRQEAQQEIAEADQEMREERHGVGYRGGLDGNDSEALEENLETRREAQENIATEEQETQEAEAELQETEQQFQTQQARDAYVTEAKNKIENVEMEIATMQEEADNLEDEAAQVALNDKIARLETEKDKAEELLSDLESADEAQWHVEQRELEQQLDKLEAMTPPSA